MITASASEIALLARIADLETRLSEENQVRPKFAPCDHRSGCGRVDECMAEQRCLGREEGNTDPTEYDTKSLLDALLSVYARSCTYQNRPLHDRWVELRREVERRLGTSNAEYAAKITLAVQAHNRGCVEVCEARRSGGRCDAYTSRGVSCCDCPREDEIDLPPPNEIQSQRECVEITERGPWGVMVIGPKVGITSDDFEHDVVLWVSGDFEDDAQLYDYAVEIAKRLNLHSPSHRESRG